MTVPIKAAHRRRATRVATAGDARALVGLINAAYKVEDFFVFGPRTNVEDVTARMAAPDASFLVIDGRDGRLVAAVYVEIHGDRGHFALLSVDPMLQGQGFGRSLIIAAEEYCLAAGCTALDLEVVNLRSELPRYYKRLGFEPYDTAPFPDVSKLRREAHLIRMSKPLNEGLGGPKVTEVIEA